ncbi:MAG TPA: phospholipid carrier-dependent glycosyltransferase, partial [Anaerolineae bacterium]|nr:phospholipid carrier-dependent glycosyltransferase [Anaerolineae bacterium]
MKLETIAESSVSITEITHTGDPVPPRWGLLAILIVMVILRVLDLPAVPTWQIDEGFWALPAKNRLLFGDWNLGEWYHFYLAPLNTLLLYGVFALIGPGLVQARLWNVLLGLISVGLAYRLACRWYGLSAARLTLFIVGLNGVFIIYNRVALLETPQTFFLLLTLALWTRSIRWRAVVAGLAFAVALGVKSNSIYFLAPVYVYELAHLSQHSEGKPIRRRWLRLLVSRDWLVFLIIALGGAVLLYGWLYIHDPVNFVGYWAEEMSRRPLGWDIHGRGNTGLVATVRYLVPRMPFLIGVGMVSLAAAARRVWSRRQEAITPEYIGHLTLLTWVVSCLVFFAPQV